MDVSVAEWLAWLTSNCGRIGAIGSSPSNGLRPNMWGQKGFNPLCQCVYIYVCIVKPDIQTIHRCSHTSIHTYIYTYIHTCIPIHTYIHTYMDVSVAEWLAWLTSNCGRIGAIGSSPSNGLRPNMWGQKGFNPLCQCVYIYVCIVNPDIQTIHRCSHTSIHTYIHTYIHTIIQWYIHIYYSYIHTSIHACIQAYTQTERQTDRQTDWLIVCTQHHTSMLPLSFTWPNHPFFKFHLMLHNWLNKNKHIESQSALVRNMN